MKVLIRDVRAEDLESLYRLDQLCFEPGIAYTRAQMRSFLARPGARGAVAEIGGEIAGFAVGHLEHARRARVVTLDVHPDHRRRGLGKALLDTLLEHLSRDGAFESRLEVDAGNAGAIAFYQALGFRPGRRMGDYYGPGRAALEMARQESRSSSSAIRS